MADYGNEYQFTLDTTKMRYPMTKEKAGNVYVFNHLMFTNETLGARYGAMKDGKDIEEAFESLNFHVIIFNDLAYSEILEKLSNIAEMDHSNLGCIVIFVLTHGRNGKVFAKDVDYYPDVYWKRLNEKNSSLFLKPKLIFVQASRGDEIDEDDKFGPIVFTDPSAPTTFSIPDIPDVLLMYSCYDGFYSWRSPVTGSWFIQGLCKELKLRAKDTDILTLLTSLNQRMVVHDTGILPYNKLDNARRQIGTIVSTLTRLLYFEPGNK